MAGGFGPGTAAVGGDGNVVVAALGLSVVAADGHAVLRVGEGQREDAGAAGVVTYGRLSDGPGAAAVGRMKDARGGCAEPGIACAGGDQAGAAGREAAF